MGLLLIHPWLVIFNINLFYVSTWSYHIYYRCNTDSIENPYFYHSSNDLQEQATLKIERDMNNMTEKSNLLTSSEMKASKEELLRIGQAGTATSNDRLNLSASQCLTDRVSQLSYEIDDDSDTESNELLADV